MFDRKPWSFNGALMILKVWDSDLAANQIDFSTMAFYIQIHGLPPKWMQPCNAEKIGSQLGMVYKESVNKRLVVAGKYLRVRKSGNFC